MKTAIILTDINQNEMHSSLPVVLHKLCGKSLIEHVIDNLHKAGIEQVLVESDNTTLKEALGDKVNFFINDISESITYLDKTTEVVIVFGNNPLVSAELYKELFDAYKDTPTILTAQEVDNKVALFKKDTFAELVNNNHNKKTTEIIHSYVQDNKEIKEVVIKDSLKLQGIRNRLQLAQAQKHLQTEINNYWMYQGVTFIDPNQTYIDIDVQIGEDTTIYPNVYLHGKTTIGHNCVIYSGSYIDNSLIGAYNIVDSSKIMDSKVADHVSLGPWAHLRNGCDISSYNRIGNFVECKNVEMGEDSRCAHLTYLGDATIGSKVNIGCGTITVNYDGKDKHRTVIKDKAFIGCNVNLIAPITIGEKAVVAAGSTVNLDVEDESMAIARAKQTNKKGYGVRYIDKGEGEK